MMDEDRLTRLMEEDRMGVDTPFGECPFCRLCPFAHASLEDHGWDLDWIERWTISRHRLAFQQRYLPLRLRHYPGEGRRLAPDLSNEQLQQLFSLHLRGLCAGCFFSADVVRDGVDESNMELRSLEYLREVNGYECPPDRELVNGDGVRLLEEYLARSLEVVQRIELGDDPAFNRTFQLGAHGPGGLWAFVDACTSQYMTRQRPDGSGPLGDAEFDEQQERLDFEWVEEINCEIFLPFMSPTLIHDWANGELHQQWPP